MRKSKNQVTFNSKICVLYLIFVLIITNMMVNVGEPSGNEKPAGSDQTKSQNSRNIPINTKMIADFSNGTFNGTEVDVNNNLILAHQIRQEPYETDGNTILLSHFDNTCNGEDGEECISWLDGWKYRRIIKIENKDNEVMNYPVMVIFNTTNFDYSKAKSNGGDIRFKECTNTYLLNYWVRNWDTTGESNVWIKVPFIPNGESFIYMYYGNPLVSSNSNGRKTFEYFDDFEAPDGYDIEYWLMRGAHTPSVISRSSEKIIEGSFSLKAAWSTTLGTTGLYHQYEQAIVNKTVAVFMHDDATQTAGGVCDLEVAKTGDFMRLQTWSGNSNYYYRDYYGGGYKAQINLGARVTGWHELKAKFSTSNIEMYYDGAFAGSRSTTGYDKVFIAFCDNWAPTQTHYYDAYFVHEYLSLEPSVDIGNEISFDALWVDGRFEKGLGSDNGVSYSNNGITAISDDPNCVGYWQFDEDDGKIAKDNSGNENNGSIDDTEPGNQDGAILPQFVNGRFGNALEFDGKDDRILVPDSPSLSITKDITISIWLKFTKLPSATKNYPIVKKRKTSSDSYQLSIKDTGEPRWTIDTGTPISVDGNTPLNDGQWHFITTTWDGSKLSVYLDGRLDCTPVGVVGVMQDTGDDIGIGWHNGEVGTSWEYYNGSLDEIAIFNRAKSANEIKFDYNVYYYPTIYYEHYKPIDNQINLDQNKGTIEMWVKPAWRGNDGKIHTLFFSGYSNIQDSFYIYKGADNTLKFLTRDNESNGQGYPMVDVSHWKKDNWYHLAFTWDPMGYKQIYVDGILENSEEDNYLPNASYSKIYIGAYRNGSYVFDGVIDELRISNKVRSLMEICEYYQTGKYISEVIDTGEYVDWETISWNATLAPDTSLYFQTRTSNDNLTWTNWTGNSIIAEDNQMAYLNNLGEEINAELSQYIQWQAVFKTDVNSRAPLLHNITISWDHLPKLSNITLTPSNPTVNDNLEIDYEYSDLDGDSEGMTAFDWHVNRGLGFVSSGIGTQSLSSSWTTAGERWFCRITPHDGKSYGLTVDTEIVAIVSGEIVKVVVIPGNITVTANELVQFDAKAYDSKYNEINAVFIWNTTSGQAIDQTGSFITNKSGIYGVSAECSGNYGYAIVIVNPGEPVLVKILPENPNVAINDEIQFKAICVDSYGNEVPGLLANWSVSGGGAMDNVNGTFEAQILGTWTVYVNLSGLLANTKITILTGEIDRLTISPMGQMITADDVLQFTVKAYDQFNNELTKSYKWWVENGEITQTGLFKPQAVGTWEISVSCIGSEVTASTTVSVQIGKPQKLLLEPSQKVMKKDESGSFSVSCEDGKGNSLILADGLSWSVSDSNLGYITDDGTFYATDIGEIIIQAKLSNITNGTNNLVGEAYITITSETGSTTTDEEISKQEKTIKEKENLNNLLIGIVIILIIIILVLLFLFMRSKKPEEKPEETAEAAEEEGEEPVEELEELEDWQVEGEQEAGESTEEVTPEQAEEWKVAEEEPLDIDLGEGFGEEMFDDTEAGVAVKKAKKGELEKPEKKPMKVKGKLPKGEKIVTKKSSKVHRQRVLKPDIDLDKRGSGKPELHTLDKIVKCNICFGNIKAGLNIITCVCGKHYHENCAKRVDACPVCEMSLKEPIDMT